MSGSISAATEGRAATYAGGIIDCCVRHDWGDQSEVLDHLSIDWQDFVGRPSSIREGVGAKATALGQPYRHPRGTPRPAPDDLIAELLRDPRLRFAVLSYGQGMFAAAATNPLLAAALVQAANDWSYERWLRCDGRLRGAILLANQLPEVAAAEVRRLGPRPEFVEVLMAGNGLGKPFGHPLYHPIYAAAVEHDLPVVIHAGGDAPPDTPSQPAAGGVPATDAEFRLLSAQPLMTHAASLVAQGVFEKFPGLRVLLVGGGAGWLPSFLWRFNAEYKALRREVPWLRRHPSDVFREHIKVGIHPYLPAARSGPLASMLDSLTGVADMLCYVGGRPGPDAESADEVAAELPEAWWSAVFEGNARALYGSRLG